jgi:hypothetical protein
VTTDIHPYLEVLWPQERRAKWQQKELPDQTCSDLDDYLLFSVMGPIRRGRPDEEMPYPCVPTRGLPADVSVSVHSTYTSRQHERDGALSKESVDAHSPSWLTLPELFAVQIAYSGLMVEKGIWRNVPTRDITDHDHWTTVFEGKVHIGSGFLTMADRPFWSTYLDMWEEPAGPQKGVASLLSIMMEYEHRGYMTRLVYWWDN